MGFLKNIGRAIWRETKKSATKTVKKAARKASTALFDAKPAPRAAPKKRRRAATRRVTGGRR